MSGFSADFQVNDCVITDLLETDRLICGFYSVEGNNTVLNQKIFAFARL